MQGDEQQVWVEWLVKGVPLWPALAFALLGTVMLVHRAPSERVVSRLVQVALGLSLVGSVVASGWLLLAPQETRLVVEVGHWFSAGEYAFPVSLQLDALSAVMMVLTSAIALLIGRFSVNYLHREPGFSRFFLLLCLFATGMLLVVSAGSVDLLFVGWEMVGVTSALLIGFFHERAMPVRSALRAFSIYRLCDMGLLLGAVLLHHWAGTAEWAQAFGAAPWPEAAVGLGTWPATVLGLCLLLAAMGKSAQLPFSSWLPRAMEGPTPSSALFYGALSVHAGLYLLLRAAPVLERAPLARAALVVVGLLTAVHATLVWRVQTDVKSSLAYSVLSQVGLMFAEVGLGLYQLALLHLVAHACLRCLQLLRAPSALRDMHLRRAAHAGQPLPEVAAPPRMPQALRSRLYRLALDRFGLEVLHEHWVLQPVVRLGAWIDRAERQWMAALSGWTSRREPSDKGEPRPEPRSEHPAGKQSPGAV
jgi:NADH-quinone oxidoreductase subunit L